MSLSYYEIQIQTDKILAEKLNNWLTMQENISFSIRDLNDGLKNETPVFIEGITDENPLWENCLISIYCPASICPSTFLKEMKKDLSLPSLEVIINELKDIDWEKHNREQFHPIKISKNLWIIPSWQKPLNKNAININLDPGLAFGTGMHDTTKLCLKWLEAHIKGHETIVDYGCGSGILAIAALKLGAKRAIGIDIDKQAIQASKENAEKNNVKIDFLDKEELINIKPDIMIANILFTPLKEMSTFFSQIIKPKKYIVLSGILNEQISEIEKIYSKWFKLFKPKISNEWACIYGKRLE